MTVAVFQPAEAAALDTYVTSLGASSNFGTDATMVFGVNNTGKIQGISRAFMRWDLTSLLGTTITAAQLDFWQLGNDESVPQAYRLFRMTQAWTELGATWNNYDGVHPWATPGGDFDTSAGPSATFTSGANTLQSFLTSAAFVALVQDAINNRAGFLDIAVRQDNELVQAEVTADSSNSATPAHYPKLTITYTSGVTAPVPAQIPGGKAPLLRPNYDHLADLRAGPTGDTLRTIGGLQESIERTTRQLVGAAKP